MSHYPTVAESSSRAFIRGRWLRLSWSPPKSPPRNGLGALCSQMDTQYNPMF